jgi:hypothetical protein
LAVANGSLAASSISISLRWSPKDARVGGSPVCACSLGGRC